MIDNKKQHSLMEIYSLIWVKDLKNLKIKRKLRILDINNDQIFINL